MTTATPPPSAPKTDTALESVPAHVVPQTSEGAQDLIANALNSLRAKAGGNVSLRDLRTVEDGMGLGMYAIAEDVLGLKMKHRGEEEPEPEGMTDEQRQAAEEAREAAEEARVAQEIEAAVRRFSVDKAQRFVCACTGLSPQDIAGCGIGTLGDLYRASVTMFMEAFVAFNGQPPKGKARAKPTASTP